MTNLYNTRIGISLLIILSFVFEVNAQLSSRTTSLKNSNHYFLSPDGDDNHSGTSKDPWRTLNKANYTLQPGDTITLLDGFYSGIISPVNSGLNSKKCIIYRSKNPFGAVLTGQKGSNYIVNLEGTHFVTIDGFKMLPTQGGFGYIRNCTHITFKNSHMENSTGVFIQLHFVDSHYNRLLFNTITHAIQRTSDSKINGDGCRFTNSTHNLIEGNSFSKIGHSPLNFYAVSPQLCAYNIIRGNIFHNGWGRNFEFFNPDRCLFEKNIISDAFNGAMSAGSACQPFFYNTIFRNNLIYDNWDDVLVTNSWDADLKYFGKDDGTVTLEFTNSRLYNNTFAHNPSTVWTFGTNKSGSTIRSNKFLNNLFFNNGYTGDFDVFTLGLGVSSDNLFHNNLFYGEEPNQASFRINNKSYTAENLNQQFPKQFLNNIDANPLFLDFENRCFALTEKSPAIDTGLPLTKTLNASSGTELYVSDARFFFDGFGIEGELGDIISVGKSGNLVRVLKADIEKNLLILDRSLRWEEGDPVSLPYAGKSPDIGAFQYGNTGVLTVALMAQPAVTVLGQEVAFSTIIEGEKGSASMAWEFGDGTISNEATPHHSYKNAGDYVVRLCCTDSSGAVARSIFLVRVERPYDTNEPFIQTNFEEDSFEEWGHLWDRGSSRERFTYYPETREDGKGQCMCVSTKGNNFRLATNIKLRIWDIDKYPYIIFSYRIPKGVPVGIWLRPWPAAEHPNKVCIGGSPANLSGEYINMEKYKLIDDGEWHMITIDARDIKKVIPELNLLYSFEFETYGKSKEGQMFWFDDFSITSEFTSSN